jgi:hypothetical protein
MNNYLLLVDTFEGEVIDEAALRTNNISGIIIRLNHVEGGLHLDASFTTQWAETGFAGLLRIPCFVYNPWVDGQSNYDWLVKHMPFEAGAVMLEVDVVYGNYSPQVYAAEVAKFCQLAGARWNYMIRTKENYLPLLNSWPATSDYWWAQYPLAMYPPSTQMWTWDQVRGQVDQLTGPSNPTMVPGHLKMWQISAERLILPGCIKPLGVSVFQGAISELKSWVNEKPEPIDPFVEEHTQPFGGVELHKVRRFNSHCFIAIIDPIGKQFLVTKFGLKKVSTVANELGAQIVINGGDFNADHAVGLHASQGKVYQDVIPYQPWVNLTAMHKPQINAFNSNEKKYNSLAGKRFIVQDGKIPPATSAAWKEVHPRTLVGITQNGKLIECVVDGRQGPNNIGVDLYNAARIMIEFGAWHAIDLDGGGSSSIWVDNRIVNSPIDSGVPGQERYVGTHLAMFVDGVVVPGIEYVVTTPVKPRLTPSMYQIITKSNLVAGTIFNSNVTRVVAETIPLIRGTKYTINWVQMSDGYWVPLFYKIEYVRKNG